MQANEVVNELYLNYNEKKLAHAFLIETNNIEKCLTDIKNLSKKLLCPEKYDDNCTNCNICYLIDKNEIPSLIIVDKGNNKEITKELIEDLKHSFIYKSSYTKNSIYIIKEAEKMNTKAYNILLKFLEEPEDNIIGFFITTLKDNVPLTIVSRCQQIKMIYDEEKNSINDIKLHSLYPIAIEFINNLSTSNDMIFYENNDLFKLIKTREDVVSFLKILYTMYELNLRNEKTKYKQNIQMLNIINKYLEQLNYNVNINLLLNSFAIEIGEFNEL